MGDLERIREGVVVRPGDKLVIRAGREMTAERAADIQSAVEEYLPGVSAVIVVAEQLLVYRPGGETDG